MSRSKSNVQKLVFLFVFAGLFLPYCLNCISAEANSNPGSTISDSSAVMQQQGESCCSCLSSQTSCLFSSHSSSSFTEKTLYNSFKNQKILPSSLQPNFSSLPVNHAPENNLQLENINFRFDHSLASNHTSKPATYLIHSTFLC